jgi:hypothetical protein
VAQNPHAPIETDCPIFTSAHDEYASHRSTPSSGKNIPNKNEKVNDFAILILDKLKLEEK